MVCVDVRSALCFLGRADAVAAGEILGIRVLDHVVIAERGFVSLREEGAIAGAEPLHGSKESAVSGR